MKRILFASLLIIFIACPAAASPEQIPVNIIFITRAIERCFIVICGGLSLYLGFKLFSITHSESGQMLFEKSGWKVKLSQVGPGVFFALFGSGILIYTLHIAPEYHETFASLQKGSSGSVSVKGAIAADINKTTATDELVGVNTLIYMLESRINPTDKSDGIAFRQSVDSTKPVIQLLTDTALGATGRFNEWLSLKNLRDFDPNEFNSRLRNDPNLAKRFKETDLLMHKTYSH